MCLGLGTKFHQRF